MASKYVDDNQTEHGVRFSDIEEKPGRKLMPIQGYAELPLVSIEEAVEPLISIVHDVKNMATWAKWKCTDSPSNELTTDQSAAIILYSMEWAPQEKCLYFVLNTTLRDENRQKLKPWFLYLKLFLTALSRLPSRHCIVYRGIKRDLRHEYQKGRTIIWWGFSSCTSTMDVLENEQFLGSTSTRTLFAIECDSGRDIRQHSVFQHEDEILLPAARQFQVVSCLSQGNDLCIIQLKETKSPVRLVELVPENIATTTNASSEHCQQEYKIKPIEIKNEQKKHIRKRLIIGNTHQLLSRDDTEHQWTFFIKFDNDEKDDIDQYIKQIIINLHPTFTPAQIILNEPPFHLTRSGWGTFTIYFTIQFHDQWKKSDLETSWILSFTNEGNQTTMDIDFQK